MDAASFFTLHDYDNSGTWTAADIRRTYGLDDESAKDISDDKKAEVMKGVLELFDKNGDGYIEREEWMSGWMKEGKRLPDFGVGVKALHGQRVPDEKAHDRSPTPVGRTYFAGLSSTIDSMLLVIERLLPATKESWLLYMVVFTMLQFLARGRAAAWRYADWCVSIVALVVMLQILGY